MTGAAVDSLFMASVMATVTTDGVNGLEFLRGLASVDDAHPWLCLSRVEQMSSPTCLRAASGLAAVPRGMVCESLCNILSPLRVLLLLS